jgi:hypothetical protein
MIPEMILRWQEGYEIVVATSSGAEALPFSNKDKLPSVLSVL